MATCQKDRGTSLKGLPFSNMEQIEQKVIIIKNYNHFATQEPMSSYKYKETNKYVFWGKGKALPQMPQYMFK